MLPPKTSSLNFSDVAVSVASTVASQIRLPLALSITTTLKLAAAIAGQAPQAPDHRRKRSAREFPWPAAKATTDARSEDEDNVMAALQSGRTPGGLQFFSSQTELFHLGLQALAADAKLTRGLRDVAAGLLQRLRIISRSTRSVSSRTISLSDEAGRGPLLGRPADAGSTALGSGLCAGAPAIPIAPPPIPALAPPTSRPSSPKQGRSADHGRNRTRPFCQIPQAQDRGLRTRGQRAPGCSQARGYCREGIAHQGIQCPGATLVTAFFKRSLNLAMKCVTRSGCPAAARAAGQRDRHDIEAIEQLFAEVALRNLAHQVAVGGGDHANVHAQRLDAADSLELRLLQDAQQLDLHLDGQLANLIEKQRALIRQLKAARLLRDGAGEGPSRSRTARTPSASWEWRRS